MTAKFWILLKHRALTANDRTIFLDLWNVTVVVSCTFAIAASLLKLLITYQVSAFEYTCFIVKSKTLQRLLYAHIDSAREQLSMFKHCVCATGMVHHASEDLEEAVYVAAAVALLRNANYVLVPLVPTGQSDASHFIIVPIRPSEFTVHRHASLHWRQGRFIYT